MVAKGVYNSAEAIAFAVKISTFTFNRRFAWSYQNFPCESQSQSQIEF